jgi:hypothetical protein
VRSLLEGDRWSGARAKSTANSPCERDPYLVSLSAGVLASFRAYGGLPSLY